MAIFFTSDTHVGHRALRVDGYIHETGDIIVVRFPSTLP
jgi:hypothetical protein